MDQMPLNTYQIVEWAETRQQGNCKLIENRTTVLSIPSNHYLQIC